jgi:hypothetical protein
MSCRRFASRVLLLALACAAPRDSLAQGIEFVEPSARAGGMGGAGAAVGWNGALDTWLNPALAAGARGFAVQAASAQLLPGLEPDLHYRSTTLSVAYAGFAFSSTGRPFGGTSLVEPLHSIRVDPLGNVFFQYGWMESMSSNAAAVSAAGVADAALALAGHHGTRLADWADVSFGRSWKHAESSTGFYAASYAARDQGWAARAVPWDTRRGRRTPDGGTRLELGFGRSTINVLANPPFGLDGQIRRQERAGYAAHFTWWGPARGDSPGAAWTEAFRGGFAPLVDLTLAYDHEGEYPLNTFDRRPDPAAALLPYTVSRFGLEATFARLVTARFGYVDDPAGDVRKPSWGAGACLPFRSLGELRYDFASVPQSYERCVYRHEITVRFDPFLSGRGPRDGARP